MSSPYEPFVGIDPDTHRTAIALLYPSDAWQIRIVPVGRELKGRDAMIEMCRHMQRHIANLPAPAACAVEGQTFLMNGKARFEDIGYCASVSGAVLASFSGSAPAYCPEPSAWKGNVPKDIHHARIGKRLGFDVEIKGSGKTAYGMPTDKTIRGQLPLASDWKHGLDALGLALWVRDLHGRNAK